MTERNPNDELRQEVNSLKSQVQRLNNIVWIVGIVAVIFGISGSWGAKTLFEAQKKLQHFKSDTDQYLKDLDEHSNKRKGDLLAELDKYSDEKKGKLFSELDNHSDKKKKDFDSHIAQYVKYNALADYVKYNASIALQMLPEKGDLLLSGDLKLGVRTRTKFIGSDEKWKIVKAQ